MLISAHAWRRRNSNKDVSRSELIIVSDQRLPSSTSRSNRPLRCSRTSASSRPSDRFFEWCLSRQEAAASPCTLRPNSLIPVLKFPVPGRQERAHAPVRSENRTFLSASEAIRAENVISATRPLLYGLNVVATRVVSQIKTLRRFLGENRPFNVVLHGTACRSRASVRHLPDPALRPFGTDCLIPSASLSLTVIAL